MTYRCCLNKIMGVVGWSMTAVFNLKSGSTHFYLVESYNRFNSCGFEPSIMLCPCLQKLINLCVLFCVKCQYVLKLFSVVRVREIENHSSGKQLHWFRQWLDNFDIFILQIFKHNITRSGQDACLWIGLDSQFLSLHCTLYVCPCVA